MFPPTKSRAELLLAMSPQLIADVTLCSTDEGGREYGYFLVTFLRNIGVAIC